MARYKYNGATEMMIDLVCDDLERYDATCVDTFKNEVLRDHGLTDDCIETEFANGYSTDAIYTVAIQAFIAQVDWRQVRTKYWVR